MRLFTHSRRSPSHATLRYPCTPSTLQRPKAGEYRRQTSFHSFDIGSEKALIATTPWSDMQSLCCADQG
ncbi:hypothetical protein GT037_009913 [Alternaria burnsii]|uniref:Uncharacterized protein n=1 Tax=Alternaria burnsii TaxID=1187904 RepID=A0A8H7AVE7_9PLEO|nr:uncharacterized protein GT037_009913 [Alternaria burnsii]KAF7672014.1 hypothetical protein GT037_009913 [Alternaria burnsii]